MDDGRCLFEGDNTQNESYVDYGADIIAVADGTISSTVDKLDANAPGVLPADDPVLGPQITVETVDGNHIVEDIGGGAYAFYAHLEKGSVLVKPGDTVKKGQVIAKLGNTGNANVSHMHFHLMNGPSVLGSDGIPYVLDTFDYAGQVDPSRRRGRRLPEWRLQSGPARPVRAARGSCPMSLAIDFLLLSRSRLRSPAGHARLCRSETDSESAFADSRAPERFGVVLGALVLTRSPTQRRTSRRSGVGAAQDRHRRPTPHPRPIRTPDHRPPRARRRAGGPPLRATSGMG